MTYEISEISTKLISHNFISIKFIYQFNFNWNFYSSFWKCIATIHAFREIQLRWLESLLV
jgi:hypothetical protein